MKKTIIILAALAALVYAISAGMQWLTPRVEKDLTDRVNVALAEQGLLWADVTTTGRNVTLSGEAPNMDMKDKALAAAARVFGVAQVTDGLTVAEADAKAAKAKINKAYALTITKQDDEIHLSGQVDSEQSKEVIERIAATHYGVGHVTSDLTVADDAPAGWRSAVGTVLFNMVNLENAEAKLAGREVMISGTVVDAMYSNQLSEQLGTALPREYKLALAVDVVAPTPMEEVDEAPKSPVEEAADSKEEVQSEAAKDEVIVTKIEPAAGETPSQSKLPAPLAGKLAEISKEMGICDTATAKTVTDAHLYFGFDRAEVTDEGNATAKKVAAALSTCANMDVELAGYTDTTGSPLYNQWLSEQRAEAGARALVRNGIARSRLTVKGYGETDKPGDNSTRAGRAQNRRVDFIQR